MLRNNTNDTDMSLSLKRKNSVDSKQQQILVKKIQVFQNQISKNLDYLFQMRIIEKLARPISLEDKQMYIQKFNKVLKLTHSKMEDIENNFNLNSFQSEKDNGNSSKQKKKMEQTFCIKVSLFNIRKKYFESLTQSSLLHFSKLKQIFKINMDIILLDVDAWLSKCTRRLQKNYDKQNICC